MDLLLLPGLVCDAAVWTPVLRELGAAAECRVPEYGDAKTLPAMAGRVLAAAPARFAVAGHSLGGRVTLEIVRRAPERVLRLALLDTGFRALPAGAAGEEEVAKRLALVALARAQGMRAMAREWVRPMIRAERLAERTLVDAILDMFERRTADEFAGQIEALIARPDATALLGTIACPTLVLCGRDDGWSTPAQHEEMAARIPGARLAVIERCGHMAPMERPREVGAALAAWMTAPAAVAAAQP